MSNAQSWWILAGLLVAAELLNGTFYLLMLALAMSGGAIAALAGASLSLQILSASLLGVLLTGGWHLKRRRHPNALPTSHNRDVNLDIGEIVHVTVWSPEGTTKVTYRGTQWNARSAPKETMNLGRHQIVAVEGNWLVLSFKTPD
jgi:membrane protein implicated in regulation of membrane protease activity